MSEAQDKPEVHDPKGQLDRSELPADVVYAEELTSKRLAKMLREATRYNLERRGWQVSPLGVQSDRDVVIFSVRNGEGTVPPRFLVTVERIA